MDRFVERCAGLDVHKDSVAATVRVPGSGRERLQETRTFQTTTRGLLTLGLVVWRWQDPFTALYTAHEQHKLTAHYEQRLRSYAPASRSIALEAKRYRLSLHPGDPVGRLRIPRLGLTKIVVDGTDESELKKGPGRYLGSFLPGE